jgi:hypothetical protein
VLPHKPGSATLSSVLLERRDFFKLLSAGFLGVGATATSAHASQSVAVTLEDLVRRSRRIALVTPLGGTGYWETVGGRRRIVTYHRIQIDELVDGDSDSGELVVRTLGGRVGKIGQVVYGEAVLLRAHPSLLFLRELGDGAHAVTARAQGHFPLLADAAGVRRLRVSPNRAQLIRAEDSAARRLVGRDVTEAKRLIRQTSRHVK